MVDNNVSSVPIVDADQKVVGVLDVLDVTHHLLQNTDVKYGDNPKIPKSYHFHKHKFSSVKAMDVSNISHRNQLVTVSGDETVAKATVLLATKGTHRLFVVNDKEELTGVISQMDISKLFCKNIDSVSIGDKTLKELKFGYCEVHRILTTRPAYNGFKRLHEKNATGLAVVDATDGHTLVGSFSAADIKVLGANPEENHKKLEVPVSEYFDELKAATSISQHKTLKDLAKTLEPAGTHRAFLIGDDEHATIIGVISLTDIVRLVRYMIE
jgi:predicted transcriptional regulator